MSHETARSHHVVEDPAEERLCRALRSLPARIPPAGLTTSLRVIASRERQRFLERRTPWQAVATWYQNASFNATEVMRSTALPFAGGVFTAVILFSTWLVPTYPLHAKSTFDVPTMLTTEASVEETRMAFSGGEVLLDVTIDDQGSVVDYTIVSGDDLLKDARQRSRLANLLLSTQFNPATAFGRPVASKVRLFLQPGIDVKD